MRYATFGTTGLRVSRLCLGCMSYGGRGGPTHPWALDEEASLPFFREAVESDINFFDTADHYNHGASERITGRAPRLYARREEIVGATKPGQLAAAVRAVELELPDEAAARLEAPCETRSVTGHS